MVAASGPANKIAIVYIDPAYQAEREQRKKEAQDRAKDVVQKVTEVVREPIHKAIDAGRGPSEAAAKGALTGMVAANAPSVAVCTSPVINASVDAAGQKITGCVHEQIDKSLDERLPAITNACVGQSVESSDPSLRNWKCI